MRTLVRINELPDGIHVAPNKGGGVEVAKRDLDWVPSRKQKHPPRKVLSNFPATFGFLDGAFFDRIFAKALRRYLCCLGGPRKIALFYSDSLKIYQPLIRVILRKFL